MQVDYSNIWSDRHANRNNGLREILDRSIEQFKIVKEYPETQKQACTLANDRIVFTRKRRSESRGKRRKCSGKRPRAVDRDLLSGLGWPASSRMKTRTSSYKLLRKRHNYGRRGSEASALAHVGRALNDELDTVRQANEKDRVPATEKEGTRVRVPACVCALRQSPNRLPISPRFLFG